MLDHNLRCNAQIALGKTEGGFLPASATGALQELLPDLFCVCYSTHINEIKEAEGSPQ